MINLCMRGIAIEKEEINRLYDLIKEMEQEIGLEQQQIMKGQKKQEKEDKPVSQEGAKA